MSPAGVIRWRWLVILLLGVGAPAARAFQGPPPPELRLPFSSARQKHLASEHFDLRYLPDRVTDEQAENARRLAEAAWEKCRKVFGEAPESRIWLDLSPDFMGASGFTYPGEWKTTERRKRPFIGIRFAELDYLGPSPEYVTTHEVAHVFSGELARSCIGEGIADWAAGTFAGVPMGQWWGHALREGGLWIDPEGFFITGNFKQSEEVDARSRTARYAESALLLKHLVDRYGWPKVREFIPEYSKRRGPLDGNNGGPEPSPAAVKDAFQRHFGEPWEKIRADWEKEMDEPEPPGLGDRLIEGERIYGAVRSWEMYLLHDKPTVDATTRDSIREAFREANRRLTEGDVKRADQGLQRAESLVRKARRGTGATQRFRTTFAPRMESNRLG